MGKAKKNIYKHEIELELLFIKNKPRENFRKLLENVKYRGYEVEQISNGRKIVITKPGGKFIYGTVLSLFYWGPLYCSGKNDNFDT